MKKLYFFIFLFGFYKAYSSSLFDLIENSQDEKFIEAIFNGANINQVDKDGNTYLHKAIFEQNKNIIYFILNHKDASIDTLNHKKQSPFLLSILMNDLFSLDLLIKKGLDISLLFKEKNFLSFVSDPIIARVLIKNIFLKKDQLMRDIFEQALKEGNVFIIKAFLKEHPSFFNYRDKERKTPLHYLYKIKSLVDRFELADFLITNNADVNAIDIHDRTPLFYNLNSEFLSKKLVENGADIHHRDFYKESVLFDTVRIGNLSLLQYFLKKGMDLRKRNFYEETLLMHARDPRILKFLIQKIDTRSVDRYGNNVLHHVFKDEALGLPHKEQLFLFFKKYLKKGLFFQKNSLGKTPVDRTLISDQDLLFKNQKIKNFTPRNPFLRRFKIGR